MPDVVFLSSVFGQQKIAEPMGACILTACLRKQGFDVEILEPSVRAWTIEESVDKVAARDAPIVAISVLRDKNVKDVLAFVRALRLRCPDRFIVLGGHGPSIAVQAILPDYPQPLPRQTSPTAQPQLPQPRPLSLPRLQISTGPVVDPMLTDRGKGAGDLGSEALVCSSTIELDAPSESPYFDKTREYLAMLDHADAYMLSESDRNFPVLVQRVLAGEDWRDIPGVVYLDDGGLLIRNPLPPKIVDLDEVPFMARDVLDEYRLLYGRPLPASLLASRGCFYRCTFCSVVQYERLQEGKHHRQRSNANIVAEIECLHQQHGVTAFNFEDDNFIVKSNAGREKIHDLCDRILALPFPVRFTLFCRADVVERELFAHLREAGLEGIYFGVESVYPGDLEFFHKGFFVDEVYRALDVLLDAGFSPRVGAERRIMFGYITWHPLTSFASLRATSRFVREYEAPPKLLRRKLRLYSATQAVADVARLGLLDPAHRDGWRFADRRIQGLDELVDSFAATVNRVRDRVRTLEKAHVQHGFALDGVSDFRRHRLELDGLIHTYFDAVLDAAEAAPEGATAATVDEVDARLREALDEHIETHSLNDAIAAAYAECGFRLETADLFRK